MNTLAAILDGPITQSVEAEALVPAHTLHAAPGLVGATLRFEGIVRRMEDARPLIALDYETYDPMASRELARLTNEVAARHALTSLHALHSRGRVPVGSISFILIAHSPHRAEALSAVTEFIDRLKQEVPIWKHPVWA